MLDLPDYEGFVSHAWNSTQLGTPMYQLCGRIKSCRVALLKLKGLHQLNSGNAIQRIKQKMSAMQLEGGNRNWGERRQLQKHLSDEYNKE